MQETQKAALSVEDAAIFLGFKKSYIYKLVSTKKLACYRPLGGKVYFRKDELESFLFRNRQAADSEETGHDQQKL